MNSTQLILLIIVLSIAVSSKNKENRIILVSLSLLLFFCMNKEIILQGFCVMKADAPDGTSCSLNTSDGDCVTDPNCVVAQDGGGCSVESGSTGATTPSSTYCQAKGLGHEDMAAAETDCVGQTGSLTGCKWTPPTAPSAPAAAPAAAPTVPAPDPIDCSDCVVDELFWLTGTSGSPIPTWNTYTKQTGEYIPCSTDPDNDPPTSCDQCSPGTISGLITNTDKGDDVKCVDKGSYGDGVQGDGGQDNSGNDASQSYYEEFMGFF